MTTNLEQLQVDVALALTKVEYDWQDTETNLRLVDEIRNSIDTLNFDNNVVPSATHIAEVAVACNEYLQIRDFLMGVRSEKEAPKVALYLTLFKDVLSEDYVVPFATVLSSYLYEFGMAEEAHKTLDFVFDTNPDYSLAQLLKNVYMRNWPTEFMAQMANDLHQSVLNVIANKETE